MPSALERSFNDLRAAALAYPESHEDFPWGHSAIKIKKKVFVFLYFDPTKSEMTMSTKLPSSSEVALLLPFATPTGYGLARSGWVTASFRSQDEVPVDLLRSWIDESFRAIAPAKLLKPLAEPTTKTTTKPSKNPTKSAKNPAAKSTTKLAKNTTTKSTTKSTKNPATKASNAKPTARTRAR